MNNADRARLEPLETVAERLSNTWDDCSEQEVCNPMYDAGINELAERELAAFDVVQHDGEPMTKTRAETALTFGELFKRLMVQHGHDPQSLTEAVNARGQVTIKVNRIIQMRQKKQGLGATPRKAKELAEIAAVFGLTLPQFIEVTSKPSGPTKPASDDEILERVRAALSGPRGDWLRQQIDEAYTAGSRRRRG